MSSKGKSSTSAGDGEALVPKLRFPEFQYAAAWDTAPGDELFQQVSNREAPPGLPILAITQEHGAIPRHMIDYNVSVTDKSLETYKEVRPGDFIISLRSFQGGIEFSEYHGICSPAYVILRKRGQLSDRFYRQHFKSHAFIQQLTRNLEGLRDGKMISYKQFSELQLLKPTLSEQQKIADCLDSADALIAAQGRKVEALRAHKKGLMQQLFPQEGETQPRLRFPEFEGAGEWRTEILGELLALPATYGIVTAGSFQAQGVPMLRGGDIKEGKLASGAPLVAPEISIQYKRTVLKLDDVVIALVGYPGEAAVVPIHYVGANISRAVGLLRLKDRRSARFIAFYLNSPAGRRSVLKPSAGSAQVVVNLKALNALVLPITEPAEQQRIADCLTSLDDLIAAETRKLDALKTHKKGLMQQLFPVIEEPQS